MNTVDAVKRNRRRVISKLMRRTHLYLALFLSPWIAMYAVSTIAMHHRELLTGAERRIDPSYDIVRQVEPYVVDTSQANPQELARQILIEQGLAGAFSVRGTLESGKLTILRDRPIGSYRLTYEPVAQTLLVERQQFGMSYFLEMLHRRRGYTYDYAANDLWGLIVDGVIVAIVLWAISGIWMWLGMSRTRKLGSACVMLGFVLFSVLLWIL